MQPLVEAPASSWPAPAVADECWPGIVLLVLVISLLSRVVADDAVTLLCLVEDCPP